MSMNVIANYENMNGWVTSCSNISKTIDKIFDESKPQQYMLA